MSAPGAAGIGQRLLLAGAVLAGCAWLQDARAASTSVASFQIRAVPETGSAVRRQVVASKGAVMTATARDGTVFRLTIPPKALPLNTVVTLTPLTQMVGVPGQTVHHGVDIEPAGTRLMEFARLEIIPRVPLPKSIYWLEHKGVPARLAGRPAFPAPRAGAMQVSHFSGGSVVGASPETTQAMNAPPNGVFDKPGSTSWLEWQRNVIEQDYRQGRVDKISRDAKMAIINERLLNQGKADLYAELSLAEQHARLMSSQTEALAARGRLEDMALISELLSAQINAVRNAEAMGLPATFDPLKPVLTYFNAVMSRCETQPVPPVLFINLAHEAALLGQEISMADLTRCVCAGPEKPAEFCVPPKEVRHGWAIREVINAGGISGEVTGQSCDLKGPWTIHFLGRSGGGNWNFAYGPFLFDESKSALGGMTGTSDSPYGHTTMAGKMQATLVDQMDVHSIALQSLQMRSTVCVAGKCRTVKSGPQAAEPPVTIRDDPTECK